MAKKVRSLLIRLKQRRQTKDAVLICNYDNDYYGDMSCSLVNIDEAKPKN